MTVHIKDLEVAADFLAVPLNHKTSRAGRHTAYSGFVKPALEGLAILIALPVVVPLIAVLALLVSLDGHNPFYTQKRVGLGGRTFRIWKLRTMVPNADTVLQAYLDANPKARVEWTIKQKLQDDPRITRIGRILRKTSLDELPQLFNVLSGSMALVGPRPMMVDQRSDYQGRAYFSLRPGITGLWQVSARNNSSFADRVGFDDLYAATVSLRTDIAILWRTFGVVLRGTGC